MAGNNRRNIAAGSIGTALEMYDFAVYGFLAPILGPLFFPSDDHLASLLSAFAVFAVGYLARPLGAALFGHIGDRYGRKISMAASISLMGIATLCLAVLPTHAQLGTTAALLLVICRIAQGLSLGGEYTGSMVFLAEHAPIARRGAMTAISQTSSIAGFLIGSGLCAFISWQLGETEMAAWGWRIPFIFGAVIAVGGLVIRRFVSEPPGVLRQDHLPVLVVFRDHWRILFRMICMLMMGGVGFYLLFVYVAAYLREFMHFTTARALEINTISLLVILLTSIPFAMLSDRVGRKPVLYGVAIATLVLGWPLWQLLHHQSFAVILSGQIGLALISAATFAVIPATISEMMPAHIRCSGASIGYNISLGLFGGTAPFVATYLVERTGDDSTPAYYMMALAVIMLLALRGMRETAGKPLAVEPIENRADPP
ncbi:MFS transporter [Nitratireductor sp. XY-223]|uniref:MFS transporter n=1 Tax=Nitratireductor sp. XY-223 TaxID=2561926 RepID=UPI00145B1D5C|nr:MFS transporter [Nitratireductor sp. XY-223]